jgi:alkylhydroperoxidase family enzyme
MHLFSIVNNESAPDESKEILRATENRTGSIPNIYGVMAESSVLLKAYKEIGKLFNETSFSPIEREVIEMTINRANGCAYCIAAHSYFDRLSNFPEEILTTLLQDKSFENPKLQTLRSFTKTIIEKRG